MPGTGTERRVFSAHLADIRRRLESSELRPGQLLGSEYAFARDTGVSRMSVRRAINTLVAEGRLERRPRKGIFVRGAVARRVVQFVIAKDAWAPWMLTQGKPQPAARAVGPGAWDPWLAVARGADECGRRHNTQVQICDLRADADLARLRALPASGVAGAIVVSVRRPQFGDVLLGLKQADFPVVLLDRPAREAGVASVTADDHAGGYQVGTKLAALGHRRIAFVGDLKLATHRARLDGLREAVSGAGLAFDRERVIDLAANEDPARDQAEQWSSDIERIAARLVRQPDRPTAVFAGSDVIAAALMRHLVAASLAVPKDVSVVGFDDAMWSAFTSPPLASVRQPLFEIGQAAMGLLLERIANPDAAARPVALPAEWVPRESVGPASQN